MFIIAHSLLWQIIADKNEIQTIKENFKAIVCDMKISSTAQVCCLTSIKVIAVRTISDNINNENSHLDYEKFKETATIKDLK